MAIVTAEESRLKRRVDKLESALEMVKSWDITEYMVNGEFSLPIKLRKIIADALDKTEDKE